MTRALMIAGLTGFFVACLTPAAPADDDYEDYLEDRREAYEDYIDDREDYFERLNRANRRFARRGYYYQAPRGYVSPPVYGYGAVRPYYGTGFGTPYGYNPFGGGYYGGGYGYARPGLGFGSPGFSFGLYR